jgi:hypothetical protein
VPRSRFASAHDRFLRLTNYGGHVVPIARKVELDHFRI